MRRVPEPTELLASVELFSELDKGELKKIAGSMKEVSYPAGREIVTQGTGGVGFFVVSEGRAKVVVDGNEVSTLGPGDHFGEVALLAGTERTATVTAETDLVCYALSAWTFKPLVESNGKLAWKLLGGLAHMLSNG
jgi:CRP-like cAMP-binding protein